MNQVILIGRLVEEPILRQSQNGVSVCRFPIAVKRQYGKETDFLDCVSFRGTAEFINQHFAKGEKIALIGSVQSRTYTDKNDNKRKAVEIIINNAEFVESKKVEESQYEEVDDFDDSDIPF